MYNAHDTGLLLKAQCGLYQVIWCNVTKYCIYIHFNTGIKKKVWKLSDPTRDYFFSFCPCAFPNQGTTSTTTCHIKPPNSILPKERCTLVFATSAKQEGLFNMEGDDEDDWDCHTSNCSYSLPLSWPTVPGWSEEFSPCWCGGKEQIMSFVNILYGSSNSLNSDFCKWLNQLVNVGCINV